MDHKMFHHIYELESIHSKVGKYYDELVACIWNLTNHSQLQYDNDLKCNVKFCLLDVIDDHDLVKNLLQLPQGSKVE